MEPNQMDKQIIISNALFYNAVRWSLNILIEVLSNHGQRVDNNNAQRLREAVNILQTIGRYT